MTVIAHLFIIQDMNYTEIADEFRNHRSRKIKKGLFEFRKDNGTTRDYYGPQRAQKENDNNATAKGPNLKIDKNHEIAQLIEKKSQTKQQKKGRKIRDRPEAVDERSEKEHF